MRLKSHSSLRSTRMHRTTFITQNQRIYTIRRIFFLQGVLDKDDAQAYNDKGFLSYLTQWQVLGWCLFWHNRTTDIDVRNKAFCVLTVTRGHGITEKTGEVDDTLPLCIPTCTTGETFVFQPCLNNIKGRMVLPTHYSTTYVGNSFSVNISGNTPCSLAGMLLSFCFIQYWGTMGWGLCLQN